VSSDLLPPWDQLPYFQTLESGLVTASGGPGQSTLIVPGDPMRVLLVLSTSISSGTMVVTSSSTDATAGNGIALANTNLPLVINQAWWGPLTASAWYIAAGVMGSIYYKALTMKEWPRKRGKRATSFNA